MFTHTPVVHLNGPAVDPQIIDPARGWNHQPEQPGDLSQGGFIKPVLSPFGGIFRTASLALSASVPQLVGAAAVTFRTLDMLAMACHQRGGALVTRISNVNLYIFRHQTMPAWSDLMV